MKNFFGFINYNGEEFLNSSKLVSKNKTQFYKKYSQYNFYLSHHSDDTLFETDKLFIFFLGEITNQINLQNELNKNNDITTLQLIAHAYEKWDNNFIEKLEGNFVLIIYNKEKEILTLAKDKIGVLPLNFYHSDQLIMFGSRVSDFNQIASFTPQINPKSLASYLQYGCLLQPNTIFKDCYKIKSGEYNLFNLKEKNYTQHNYWKLEECYSNKKIEDSEEDIIAHAHQLLKNSINNFYPKEEKIGCSLSGGYDSSSIAALLQSRSETKINTFTIGFSDQSINEAKDAKDIAKHLGTNHHEYYFSAKDAINIIPKLSKIYDEPFAEYAATPTVLTASLLEEQGIKNIFVGDGGDEVFATADDTHFFNRIHSFPHSLRKTLSFPLQKLAVEKIPYLKNLNNFPTKYSKLLQILSSKNIPATIEARNILFRENELETMIQEYHHPILTTFNEINFQGHHETVDEIIGTYFKTTMTDGELVKSYGAMNQHDIVLKTPFLDVNLISYLASIPSSIKIKSGIKKYILKEIAYQYIPKNLLDRPKSGFDIPFDLWMKEELKELVYEQINEERLNEDKLFYTSAIIKIRDSFYQGNDSFMYKLWRIFIFQLWYQNFKG